MGVNGGRSGERHCMVVFAQYPLGETRVHREAEALIARGFAVDVLCIRCAEAGEAPAESVDGAQVYRLPVTRRYGTTSLLRQMLEYLVFFWHVMFMLMRLSWHRRYRVVQVHNLPDFLVFAAWFPRLLGSRIILDLHDLMPEFLASRSGRGLDSRLVRLVILQEQLSCHFADRVITVTELWRQTLIQRGVPPDKVSVVMNVADDRIFNRVTQSEPRRNNGTVRLLYHGVVAPRAGLNTALEAVSLLHEACPDLQLLIHGRDGQHGRALAELATRLGIVDHVVFSRDLLPLSELPRLIRSADVGVVPYRHDIFMDGVLPTKLMEYTALGLPTIVARTRAVEAYFDERMVEFFVPENAEDLAAAIRRVAGNPQRLREMSEQSDRFNQQFNWTEQSATYVGLVERLGGRRYGYEFGH